MFFSITTGLFKPNLAQKFVKMKGHSFFPRGEYYTYSLVVNGIVYTYSHVVSGIALFKPRQEL